MIHAPPGSGAAEPPQYTSRRSSPLIPHPRPGDTPRVTTTHQDIKNRITRAAAVIASLEHHTDHIHALLGHIRETFARGGRLYTCGNGGSAAEALHIAEECIGRYKRDRPPLPAVCLNADPTALTCIANDYGFDHVFARQVQALLTPRDALLVFSTSGNSPNILLALRQARSQGARTLALLGKGGGPCLECCNAALVVQSNETEHIQEAHQVVLHLILESIDADPPIPPSPAPMNHT